MFQFFVIERLLPPPNCSDQNPFNLTMMIMTGGRERSVVKHKVLLNEAGLWLESALPIR
jgi:hypothetical protein